MALLAPNRPHASGTTLKERRLFVVSFVMVVALLVGLGLASVDTLSAVRAFVGGESLWSKGQKDAVQALHLYARSRDPADYGRFMAALSVPLGDRIARLELDRADPDLDIARQGFLQGANHPDDVDGMIRLYRNFRYVSFMAEAIAIWAEGDVQIAQLVALGDQLRLELSAPQPDMRRVEALLVQVHDLNDELTQLERRFSDRLGEASRITGRILMVSTVAVAVVLGLAVGLYMHRMLQRQDRTERALRESNERWELGADAGGIGVFDWQIDTDQLGLDARAARLHGLDATGHLRVDRQAFARPIDVQDQHRLMAAVQQAAEAGSLVDARYRVAPPGGKVRHVQLIGRARVGDAGVHLTGVLLDVTEGVRAEQLRLDKEAAERASRAKDEFLSRVSHELRTPLNAIIGFTQLMQVDQVDPLTPGQSRRMAQVLHGGQHLLRLVNDILDLTRIGRGDLPLEWSSVDVADVLRASVNLVEPLAREKHVEIRQALPPGGAEVVTDPLRLQQVFVNLLSNAVKYNRRHGLVQIDCRVDGQHATVSVRDSGPGLTEHQLGQLFQPFNRLGAEYSGVEGTGLGLVITRQLLKHLRGSLEVRSEPGRGSCFEVRVPQQGVPG